MFGGSSWFPFCLVRNLVQCLSTSLWIVLWWWLYYVVVSLIFCGVAGCDLLFHCTFMCACVSFMELELFVLIDNVFGVVHEFLPLTSYLCTVYSVSSILTAPCLFPRRKGLRGGKVPVSNCKCCRCVPTTYLERLSPSLSYA